MDYTVHIVHSDGFLEPYRIFKRLNNAKQILKPWKKNIITAIKTHHRDKHKGTIEKVRCKRINAIDAAITARNS